MPKALDMTSEVTERERDGIVRAKKVDAREGASTVSWTVSANGLLELNRRQDARSFNANGIKGLRIDTQGLENGRRHLGGTDGGFYRRRREARFRQQQNDVGVVMRESAVFRLLRGAAGVRNTHVGSHDDIRRAGIYGCVVVVERERRAVEDLPERDSGGPRIGFEDTDAG